MSFLMKMPVGEIAASRPHAAKFFDAVGIDYACHGNLPLHDACAEAGLDPIEIRKSLGELPRTGVHVNWLEQPLSRLLEYLRGRRHPALTAALAHAIEVLASDCETCKRSPEEIAMIGSALNDVSIALRPHLTHEERVVFPVIEHLDRCWTRGDTPTMNLSGGLGPAVNTLMLDHGFMVARANTIRSMAVILSERDDLCPELASEVRYLDHEIRDVVHLENNVLYPRAVALEAIVWRDVVSRTGVHA